MPTRKGTHEKSQVPNVESVVGSLLFVYVPNPKAVAYGV